MTWWGWIAIAIISFFVVVAWSRWRAHRDTVQLIHKEARRHGVELGRCDVKVSRWWPFCLQIELGVVVSSQADPRRVERMMIRIWERLDERYESD